MASGKILRDGPVIDLEKNIYSSFFKSFLDEDDEKNLKERKIPIVSESIVYQQLKKKKK